MDDSTAEGVANLNMQSTELKPYLRATNEHSAVPEDAEVFDGLNSYMAHMQVWHNTHIHIYIYIYIYITPRN